MLLSRLQVLPLVITAFAAGVLSGCRGSAPSTSAATPAIAITADTWAVVANQPIMRADVEKAFGRMRDPNQKMSDDEAMTAKLNVLNDLILQESLLAKARELKLDVPETDITTAYDKARGGLPEDAFQKELGSRGLTMAEVRDGFRRELLAQKVLDQEVKAKSTVTDQEVQGFFEKNRTRFNLPEEAYHLAQIVVTPVHDPQLANSTGDDAGTPEEAGTKVKVLMERLKQGAQFQDLAAAYSEDPESARRGGDVGFVPMSKLKQAPPALQNAVLNKAPGTATVASINGGYTIVFVLEHEQAGQRDLSSPGVKDRITQALRDEREQMLRVAYMSNVRAETPVVNYAARRLLESGKSPAPLLSAPGKP
jgi:parvulin-like peptidyl-prolyl isomerase